MQTAFNTYFFSEIETEISEDYSAKSMSLVITGWKHKFIRALIWANIIYISVKISASLFTGIKNAYALKQLRNQYRNKLVLKKYRNIGTKYFFNYNAPGWPSKSFGRYVEHLLSKNIPQAPVTLHTLVFAITKKCGFKCEHCCEWENLNKHEVLEKEDLVEVIRRFHGLGISQVQLSGGEPLNRYHDILFLLNHMPAGIDSWIYTTGYQLTPAKALELKEHGLTGITISIDHHDAKQHDWFRGKQNSFQRALQACSYAVDAGLAVTFSICAVKSFITEENLWAYAQMAKLNGATFIQILEPKAVGHYAGMNVTLQQHHLNILEAFYEKINYDAAYISFPIVSYHGYYSRRIGCAGSGKDYLYVDTDGDVHNCPFCQRKLFSALSEDLPRKIEQMRSAGCGMYNYKIPNKQALKNLIQ